MRVQIELEDLGNCFEKDYGFNTETWLIPTKQPLLALVDKASQVVKDFGEADNLLIVYYGGHAAMDDSRRAIWTS